MNFIFLDSSNNYPFKYSAGNTKIEFMARSLIKMGDSVCVFNSRSGYEKVNIIGRTDDNVDYILYKKGGCIQYLKNILFQCKLIRQRKRKDNNYAVLASTSFFLMLFDIIYCRLCGYRVLFLLHELRTTIRTNKSFLEYLDCWLQDHVIGFFANAILPISHYLWDFSTKFHKPRMMVPILSDFINQNYSITTHEEKYFAYCGSIEYLDIIEIIISALKETHDQSLKLIMILYGSHKKITNLKAKYQDKQIYFLQDVPTEKLSEIYSKSLALVIPLNPKSLQDKIRFSQKIAEYLSSGRPIITINYGEILYYFRNMENAFVLDNFNSESLSQTMLFARDNPQITSRIGEEGYKLGMNYFNSQKVMIALRQFLLEKVNKHSK